MNCSELPNSILLPNGRLGWNYHSLPLVMEYAKSNRWIILGGDVLTNQGKYTYDNWYYNPNPLLDYEQNMHNSILTCFEYISKYTERNGSDFVFELVITDTLPRE